MPGIPPDQEVVTPATLRKKIAATEEALLANASAQSLADLGRRMYAQGPAYNAAALQKANDALVRLGNERKQLLTTLDLDKSKLLAFELHPETTVSILDGAVPVALLPVRLETRFFKNASELRIRIFPDQVHVHAHEPELTADERRAGEDYWRARWLARADVEARTAAWHELAARLGPRRGRWVARALTPINLAALGGNPPQFPATPEKPRDWSRAARATALPERWLAIGWAAGTQRLLFQKWGSTIPDSLATSPTPTPAAPNQAPRPGEMAIDEPMRWLVDYDSALAQGMAITVTAADLPAGTSLSGGLAKLIVLGIDWSLTPTEAALRISDLLSAHLHTDGCAFVRPGTPTNNTSETVAAADHTPESLLAALDPGNPPANFDAHSASRLLGQALGLDPADLALDAAPGATLREQASEQHMANALWCATLGYYLDELFNPDGDSADANPVVSDAVMANVRKHVVAHLHPGGPLPALRLGKQPYGVLPVMAGGYKPSAGDTFTDDLYALLTRLRPFWRSGLHKVPRMSAADTPGEIEAALLQILQTTPLSSAARFRRVFGSVTAANSSGLDGYQSIQSGIFNLIVGPHLQWPKPPRIASFVTDPTSHSLPVPWAQTGGVSETDSLAKNYLRDVAGILRGERGVTDARAALTAQDDPDTLLHSLLTRAALEEVDQCANGLVHLHHRNLGRNLPQPARAARVRIPEVIRAETVKPRPRLGAPQTNRVYSRQELSQVILPTISKQQTLAEYITATTRNPAGMRTAVMADLAGFLASLDALAARPGAELERAFRGILDAYSHRLDAWFTSLATRRLAEQRAKKPQGVYLGGYGWVFDLKPDTTPDSMGYVHAPSIPHATTAAILRSGHLSHQTGEAEPGKTPLNIDMSSVRVRRALELLRAVAEGQPLAALLGYRLERQLHERNALLMRFVLPLRRLFPLRTGAQAPAPSPSEPLEAVAARDVVNGLAVLERWRVQPPLLDLPEIKAQNPTADERIALTEEIARIADSLDAASDVLMAESVYQTVLGNYERAGAAIAALDRQGRPPEPQVVRTPRSGKGYTQRVVVLLNDAPAPHAWSSLIDARSRTDPRVNAWVGALLGDPVRIVLAARVLRPPQPGAPPVEVGRLELQLHKLGLSPLSVVFAAAPGGREQPSQLEEYAVRGFAAQLQGADESTILELLDGPPASAPAGTTGLAALRVQCDWIRKLLGAHRAVSGCDLDIPEDMPADGHDPDELEQRAGIARQSVLNAVNDLTAAIASAQVPALTSALLATAALGTPDAIPPVPRPGDEAEHLPLLLDLARAALASVQRVKDDLDRESAANHGKTLTPTQRLEAATTCIQRVFGKGFPVLPRCTPGNAVEFAATLAEQLALTVNDTLAPAGWLAKMAPVRPAINLLESVLGAAQLLGGAPVGECLVAQLPHRPGQRWLALPLGPTLSAATLALVIHSHGAFRSDRPLSGFVCDEWFELIPSREETTAMSFHYDAPAARAPQTILLAVPADPTQTKWSVQSLLATIEETIALAQLRAIGPKEIDVLAGGLLPTVYLPNNVTKDVPTVDLFKVRAYHATNLQAAGVLGKELLK